MDFAVAMAEAIGGIGLFFFGMHLLSSNLRRLTSRRFQRIVEGATGHPLHALLAGTAIGAVSQSSKVTAFITIGLVSAGFVTVAAAIPFLVGANIGATLLAYFATLDIAEGMMAIVGVTAFLLSREKLQRWHAAAGAVFGAALLLVSIGIMQSALAPLGTRGAVRETMLTYAGIAWLAFLVAMVAGFVLQTAMSVVILAMSFYDEGLLSLPTAILMVYAANAGSAGSLALLSLDFRGTALQIAAFGVLFKVAGLAVALPLHLAETAFGVPLVAAALVAVTDDGDVRIFLAFLLYNVFAAIPLLALRDPIGRFLAARFPEPETADRRRPAFIGAASRDDPWTALVLARREQARALDVAGAVLEAGRIADPAARPDAVAAAQADVAALLKAIAAHLDEIRDRDIDPEVGVLLGEAYERQGALAGFLESASALAAATPDAGERAEVLRGNLLESLDAARLQLAETVADPDPFSLDSLEAMVGEKSGILARVRRTYLERDTGEDEIAVRLALLDLTALFERAVWQLRTLATTLVPGQRPEQRAGGAAGDG